MITIASKSALILPQIQDKADKGSNFMEVHLGDELLKSPASDFYARVKKEGCLDAMDIISIHSPLLCGLKGGDTLIECPADEIKLGKTLEFAEKIAALKEHPVKVVVHISTSVETLKTLGVLQDTINRARRLADAYPKTELCIECHSPYEYQSTPLSFLPLSTGYIVEHENLITNVELVKMIEHPRVSALIDIVHVKMLSEWLQNTGLYLEDDKLVDLGKFFVSDTIKAAIPLMKHIHFANGLKHGYGAENHGIAYHKNNEEEYKEAEYILSLIIDGGFNGNIVIETTETDYLNSVNFSNTLEVVKTVLDKKGVEYKY